MSFVVFDLEFNQDASSVLNPEVKRSRLPFEIIQIGAVKLDWKFNTLSTFNRYVRPTFYTQINPYVTELTGISTEQLLSEEAFPEVYQAYTRFIDGVDSIFCIWGMTDITELFKNAEAHQLDSTLLPKMVINLQPYASRQFKLPQKNMLRLQHAAEKLSIPMTVPFHNALHDAYYTSEILKRIYNPSIQAKLYDPSCIPVRPTKRRSVIDTDKLLQQFEKMYARKMTCEEQDMIKLAYKMGRTNQFLKDL